MKTVFEPFKLAGITFSNRIIRSATFEGVGDENGKPNEQLIKKYEALAKGGVGGIITGFIGVGQQGKASDNMVMINKSENIETLKKITKRMHEIDACNDENTIQIKQKLNIFVLYMSTKINEE